MQIVSISFCVHYLFLKKEVFIFMCITYSMCWVTKSWTYLYMLDVRLHQRYTFPIVFKTCTYDCTILYALSFVNIVTSHLCHLSGFAYNAHPYLRYVWANVCYDIHAPVYSHNNNWSAGALDAFPKQLGNSTCFSSGWHATCLLHVCIVICTIMEMNYKE